MGPPAHPGSWMQSWPAEQPEASVQPRLVGKARTQTGFPPWVVAHEQSTLPPQPPSGLVHQFDPAGHVLPLL